LFYHCQQITEIDLSHFDASEVTSMSEMFSGCTELTSVNLANLNASKIIATQDIFLDCQVLKYINFNNAILKDHNELDGKISDLISSSTNNFVLCINEENKWTNSINNLANNFFICTNNLTNNDEYKCYGQKSDMTNEEICSISRITNEQEESFFQEETSNNYISEIIDNLNYKSFSIDIISSSYNRFDSLVNKTEIVKNIKDDLINNCNISEINNGKDLEKEADENILITLTSTNNQKYNENYNKSTINFQNCEDDLKSFYNISFMILYI
jgi:surface protein